MILCQVVASSQRSFFHMGYYQPQGPRPSGQPPRSPGRQPLPGPAANQWGQGQPYAPIPTYQRPPPARRRGCGGTLMAGIVFLLLTCLVFGGLGFGYAGIASALPNPDELQERASSF